MPGPKGERGYPGNDGPKGYMGPKGAIGLRGLPGAIGECLLGNKNHYSNLRYHAWLIKFISNSKLTLNAIKSKDQLELIISRHLFRLIMPKVFIKSTIFENYIKFPLMELL